MIDPRSALVLFSGGQDSTACLAWALARYARVETIGFDYGQRHRIELDCRAGVREALAALNPDWAARLGDDHLLDLALLGQVSDTALTSDRAIEFEANGLPNTFVPGRNLLLVYYQGGLNYLSIQVRPAGSTTGHFRSRERMSSATWRQTRKPSNA